MDWGAVLSAVRDQMDEDPEEQRRRAALAAMRPTPQEGPKENTRAKLDGVGLPPADLSGFRHDDRALPGTLRELARNPQNLLLPPAELMSGRDEGAHDLLARLKPFRLPAVDLSGYFDRGQETTRPPALPPYDPSKIRAMAPASEDTQAVQALPAAPGLAMKKPAISPGTIDALIKAYDDELAGQPSREDVKYKPQRMKTWQTIAGAALATLAGAGSRNPRLAGELASDVFGTPKREADERFNRDVEDWRRRTQGARGAIDVENVASEIRDRDARAGAYADWRSQDREDLQALHAAAARKAVQEGRDPASDPTVQRYADAITSLQREPAGRNETPFSVWRKQHPDADVSDYFKLGPEAREDARKPEQPKHLTPGQKATATRRYKQSLADIEAEFRARQGGTYVDKRTGELLSPMSEDELARRKQDAEDAYKDELEAGGENVNRYDYRTGRSEGGEPHRTARGAGAQHQVGDVVTYKGKQYRIGSIRGGRAQLVPLGQ